MVQRLPDDYFIKQLNSREAKKLFKRDRARLERGTTNLQNIIHSPRDVARALAKAILLNNRDVYYYYDTKKLSLTVRQSNLWDFYDQAELMIPEGCTIDLNECVVIILVVYHNNYVINSFRENNNAYLPIFVRYKDIFKKPKGKYQVYQWFSTYFQVFYTGLTGRSVLTRLSEHLNADSFFGYILKKGIQEAISDNYEAFPVIGTIREFGLDRKTAFRREAELIQAESLYPKGQNLSPGGEAGARLYYNLGYTKSADYTKITDDEYEKAELSLNAADHRKKNNLNDKFIKHAKIEITDEMRNRMVFGNARNLNKAAVNQIKLLRLAGYSLGEVYDIVKEFGNFSQIEGVYKGRTFYWDTWAE